MAKKTPYSVYNRIMDMPFTFEGSFDSKKKAEAHIKTRRADRNTLGSFIVIVEEKPDLAIGGKASGWNAYPVNYVK